MFMEQQKRDNGYYWVKLGGIWIVAEWLERGWFLTGHLYDQPDSYFEEIDESKIERGEHSRLLQSAIEKVNKLTPHHYGTRKAVVLDEVLEILNDPSI